MKIISQKGKVYTAGVFDLFHAGHMESIMKILDCFPEQELLIGVATDKYTKFFKRTPFQTQSERLHSARHYELSLSLNLNSLQRFVS